MPKPVTPPVKRVRVRAPLLFPVTGSTVRVIRGIK